MTGARTQGRRPDASRIAAVPDGVLAVLVRCRHLLCALPAAGVRRLLLADEVERETAGGVPCVRANGARFAVWELGALLGVPQPPAAFILLDVRRGSTAVPVALATGPCLAVQELVRGAVLPGPLFRERRAAFAGVFPVERARVPVGDAAFGLWIEPAALLSPEELTAAEAAGEAP
jgi:hypothetical protein